MLEHTRHQRTRSYILVSTKNHDLWAGHGPIRDSRTFDTLRMLGVKPDKSDWLRIQNDYSAHARKIEPSQRQSRSQIVPGIAIHGANRGLGE